MSTMIDTADLQAFVEKIQGGTIPVDLLKIGQSHFAQNSGNSGEPMVTSFSDQFLWWWWKKIRNRVSKWRTRQNWSRMRKEFSRDGRCNVILFFLFLSSLELIFSIFFFSFLSTYRTFAHFMIMHTLTYARNAKMNALRFDYTSRVPHTDIHSHRLCAFICRRRMRATFKSIKISLVCDVHITLSTLLRLEFRCCRFFWSNK